MSDLDQHLWKDVDVGLQWSYGYGVKPLSALELSAFIILLFGVFWNVIGLGSSRKFIAKYNIETIVKADEAGAYTEQKIQAKTETKRELSTYSFDWWKNQLFKLVTVFSFSFELFLSGTRFFIDPPQTPEIPGRSTSLIRVMFIAERIFGATLSVLFFIALGATIMREAI